MACRYKSLILDPFSLHILIFILRPILLSSAQLRLPLPYGPRPLRRSQQYVRPSFFLAVFLCPFHLPSRLPFPFPSSSPPFPPPHLLSLPPTGNLDYLPFNASHFKVLVSLIYLFYCVCSTIILLNLLIALMGDSYDKVQENALAQGRYEQVDRKGEREGKLEGRGKEEGDVTHSRFQVYFLMLLHPIPLLS